MVLLFYVYYFLIFSPSKDIIYDVHDFLQADVNIDYDGGIRSNLRIYLYCHTDDSICIV